MTQSSRTTPRTIAGLAAGALITGLGVTVLGAGVSSAAAPTPTTTNFTFTCNGAGLPANSVLNGSATATPPENAVAGVPNQLTGFSTTITLPANIVANLNAAGVAKLSANTQSATLTATNGTITSPTGLAVPPTAVPPSGTLPLTTNAVSTAVTPATAGTDMINIGNLVTNLRFLDAAGNPIAGFGDPSPFTCTPPTANTILSFAVSAPAPTPSGQADLAVAVAAPPFSGVGTPIPVTTTVTNNGPGTSATATATVITPGYLISGASSGGKINMDGTTSFPVPVLTKGQSVTFTVTAVPSAAFQFGLGVAYVYPAGQDPNLFNNIGFTPIVTR